MSKVFRDRIVIMEQFDISPTEDIFSKILERKKQEIDNDRFYISCIPPEEFVNYDFSKNESIDKFRQDCFSDKEPLKPMGGCNLREEEMSKGIRYAGMKISDPYGIISGVFDINNGIITYSPIFPLFYEERDYVKFARDKYFTSLTFEEIILNQINNAIEYYVHVDNYSTNQDILKYGNYVYEKITKEKMIEFATSPEEGKKILSKHLENK